MMVLVFPQLPALPQPGAGRQVVPAVSLGLGYAVSVRFRIYGSVSLFPA